jgi:hypothetical protein
VKVTAETLKNTHFLALLLVPLILGSKFALAGRLIPDRQTLVLPSDNPAATTLSGKDWSYTVPFPVHNKALIERLIQCESQGVNISRPDSNGLTSWGILQFNGTSTWADMEQRFNFTGSPLIPDNAIHLADIMISGGFLGRWTCAKILHLSPPKTQAVPTLSPRSAQAKRR